MSYIYQEEIVNSLNDFSNGKILPILKNTLKNLNDFREFLLNPETLLSFFQQLYKTGETSDFFEFLQDLRLNFFEPISLEKNPSLKNKIFFNSEIKDNYPLFVILEKYLNDTALQSIIKDYKFYTFTNNVDKEFANNFLISIIDKNHKYSLQALKEEYFLFNNLNRYDDIYPNPKYNPSNFNNEESEFINLENLVFHKSLKNPDILPIYSHIFYTSIEISSDNWFNKKLDENKKDTKCLKQFFDQIFPLLNKKGQEQILANCLSRTDNLDLLNYGLSKLGIPSIKSYQPEHVPVWIYSSAHNNKSISIKLLSSNVDLFDYYEVSNKTFLNVLLENTNIHDMREYLEKNKVSYKDIVKKLFEEKTDNHNNKTNYFSLLCSTLDSKVNEILNLKTEDLGYYDNYFKKTKFNSLKDYEKVEKLNKVLEDTFLKEVYINESNYYSKTIKNKKINLNSFMSSDYFFMDKINLVYDHLELIENLSDKKFQENLHMTEKYFPAIEGMFEHYTVRNIKQPSPLYNMYVKMIDYVSTNPNLPWDCIAKKVTEILDKKTTLSEGGKSLLTYLNEISLQYTLKQNNLLEKNIHTKTKLKI